MPLADRSDVPPPRVAIQAAPSEPETATPRAAMREFWIALFLVALLVWWCVDHIIIARRKR